MFYVFIISLSAQCFNEDGVARSWFRINKLPNGYDYLYAGFQIISDKQLIFKVAAFK